MNHERRQLIERNELEFFACVEAAAESETENTESCRCVAAWRIRHDQVTMDDQQLGFVVAVPYLQPTLELGARHPDVRLFEQPAAKLVAVFFSGRSAIAVNANVAEKCDGFDFVKEGHRQTRPCRGRKGQDAGCHCSKHGHQPDRFAGLGEEEENMVPKQL